MCYNKEKQMRSSERPVAPQSGGRMKKLFVSSTFKDMQLERDALKNHIIPNLNMQIREYGVKIGQTDLRWGISTTDLSAEEGEQKILNVCLDEINKSRPYMIVMLGERYGWIPSPAIIEMNARGRDIHLASNDISVTQLEIEYIAFTERWDESRIFFYFRELDTSGMDDATREIYAAESDAAKKKLDALKKRIEEKFPTQVRKYRLEYKNGGIDGIEDFEKMVSDDLYSLFKRDLSEDEAIDVNIRVRDKLHKEAIERLDVYTHYCDVSHTKSKKNIAHHETDLEQTHLYVAEAPGYGKTMSVSAAYAALYAYQNKGEPCWQIAKPLFEKYNDFYRADGTFSTLPDLIDTEKTFPLFLQVGSGKDMQSATDFLRTLCYYLTREVGIDITVPDTKPRLYFVISKSLQLLSKSDRYFYLFADDISPELLNDLFEIEHRLDAKDVVPILKHFFFYLTLDNSFSQVPAYLPFYEYSDTNQPESSLLSISNYIFSYAKKLGKELSAGVVRHIKGYYSLGDDKFKEAGYCSITRPQANLIANYFMNLTREDYEIIKLSGNGMEAIEARQLALLHGLREGGTRDLEKSDIGRLAELNIKKFEKNHDEQTLLSLGTIYVLSGMSFTMEEAEYLYSALGREWSDLSFISYFDDFRQFFAYNAAEDSYRILPVFQASLRGHFIKHHLPDVKKTKKAVTDLLLAIMGSPFHEAKRDQLILPILLVNDSNFISESLDRLSNGYDDEYAMGLAMGKNAERLLHTLSAEEAGELGRTLSPIIFGQFTNDAIDGFFNGIGQGFQDHEYEKCILAFADALLSREHESSDTVANALVRIALLRAYCYIGWQNDRAINILYEQEPYLSECDRETRLKFISTLSILLRRFDVGSPMFEKIKDTVVENLYGISTFEGRSDRALLYRGDAFTVSYFLSSFGIAHPLPEHEWLLEPFLEKEYFAKMGLYNIESAICSLDREVIGDYPLFVRSRTFMECLSFAFPSSAYAARLTAMCFNARLNNIHPELPPDRLEDELARHYFAYEQAIFRSADNTGYHFVNYGMYIRNTFYVKNHTRALEKNDDLLWRSTEMRRWTWVITSTGELSFDLVSEVCYAYITFLRLPDFHDMLSDEAAKYHNWFAEEEAEEPSIRAILFRLTVSLAAVLHNPNSRILKPRLKKLFKTVEEHYGDYAASLASPRFKFVKRYIEEL